MTGAAESNPLIVDFSFWGSINREYPRKYHLEMDDHTGYPYFRKRPCKIANWNITIFQKGNGFTKWAMVSIANSNKIPGCTSLRRNDHGSVMWAEVPADLMATL